VRNFVALRDEYKLLPMPKKKKMDISYHIVVGEENMAVKLAVVKTHHQSARGGSHA
jgi:hypothetical protein